MSSGQITFTEQTFSERATRYIVFGSVVLLPLLIDPFGKESFRLPKESLFRAIAIVIAVLLVHLLTDSGGRRALRRIPRPLVFVAVAAVTWTAIATAWSTNVRLSVESLTTVVCSAIFFIGCCIAALRRSMIAIDLALIAPVVNSVFGILQEYNIWQPWKLTPEMMGHVATTALVGNPNDLGTYLLVPALATAAAGSVSHGRRRYIYMATALVLLAGLIASGTRTAIIAYVAGMAVLLFSVSRRGAILVAVLLMLAGLTMLSDKTRVGRSARALITAAKQARYDILFSERMPPFLAAYEIFRDHPFAGAGPGTFKWHYMRYRMELVEKYPEEWTRGWPMNFGETHNDHLQTLAETGIPGYAVLLTGFGTLLMLGARRRENAAPMHITMKFARLIRMPLVTTFFVVMIGQFPLQLAATRMTFLYFAALCTVWNCEQ